MGGSEKDGERDVDLVELGLTWPSDPEVVPPTPLAKSAASSPTASPRPSPGARPALAEVLAASWSAAEELRRLPELALGAAPSRSNMSSSPTGLRDVPWTNGVLGSSIFMRASCCSRSISWSVRLVSSHCSLFASSSWLRASPCDGLRSAEFLRIPLGLGAAAEGGGECRGLDIIELDGKTFATGYANGRKVRDE